jgi:tight adherence protein B
MTRHRWPLALATALGALSVPAAAGAGLEIRSVDASAYPRAQATVVASKPSRLPPQLTEKGVPVTGLIATNLGREKSIVLLVDSSRSMKGASLKNAIEAARAFAADKALNDKIAVVAFGSEAVELTELTASGTEAVQALAGIKIDAKPGTALFDAIVVAAGQLRTQVFGGRVILLVTDGRDVSSEATFATAVKTALGANALVYAIGIDGRQFRPGTLRSLTQKTGGGYRTAASSDLGGVYADVARELQNTWRLDFITSARPGEAPKIVARVPGQGTDSARLRVPVTAAVEGSGGLLPAFAYGRGGAAGLALLVGLLVLGAVALFFSSTNADRLRMKVQQHVAPKPKRVRKQKKERLQSLTGLFEVTEQALGRTRYWLHLSRLIERADLPIKPVELFYLMAACGIGLGLLFTAAGTSALLSLAALVVGGLLPVAAVWMKARRRLAAFEDQLPDLLIGIAASLKAGHSFKQGLQAIVDEGVEPAGKEFKRVLTETRLGRPLDDALSDMAERVGSNNLSFIVTAVSVQTQVGGSLASLFDMVADTVRNRQQFARKIKALTAMGRMSAYVLIGLPFFLAGALTLMNPGYMAPLFQTSAGHKMILVSLLMMVIGSLFLKKIVSFKG